MDIAPLEKSASTVPELSLVVLFGSKATGRAQPGSDTDVALLLDPDTAEARSRADAALRTGVRGDVDIIWAGDAPPLLRLEIARTGRVVWERRPGSWASFQARAMLDWFDWAPHARFLAEAAVRRNRERLRHGQT